MTYKKKICLEKSMITSTSNQQMKNLMLLMKKAKARKDVYKRQVNNLTNFLGENNVKVVEKIIEKRA